LGRTARLHADLAARLGAARCVRLVAEHDEDVEIAS
jgi:hypothetical protein